MLIADLFLDVRTEISIQQSKISISLFTLP